MVIQAISWTIETLALFTGIGILLFFFHAIFYKKGYFYQAYKENKDKLLWLAFLIAAVSMIGSLFYSEIMGYPPCTLCIWQRIFMYPLVLILGIAALRKDNKIGVYALPMCVIGGLIATFHYAQQVSSTFAKLSTCAAEGIPCTIKYTYAYGYLTIPAMALSAFIAIGILVFLRRTEKNL